LIARSTLEVDGSEADLLEVKYPWGDLVNAHPPQAMKVLDFRGLHLDLPRERKVSLGELMLHADLDSEMFRLTDASGRRVLPVHLSSKVDAGLSNLLRFLLVFGPGETRGVFPFAHSESNEELTTFARLTCGNLILRRRGWSIDIQRFRNRLEG